MTIADIYRLLELDERILPGDQFRLAGLDDNFWAPVEKFAGHRVREFQKERTIFRRLIAREPQV